MIRTNSKEARNAFNDYLKNEMIASERTPQNLVEDFNGYCEDSEYMTLAEFMTNIDCSLSPYYDDQRKALKECLQETEEEASKYNDEKVHNMFIYCIDRALKEVYGLTVICKRASNGRLYAVAQQEVK